MTVALVMIVGPMLGPGYVQAEPNLQNSRFKVTDGDTFKVRIGPARWRVIRLLDLDCPELSRAKCDRERHWGQMAKARLEQLLTGDVQITYKLYSRGRKKGRRIKGKYGRYLASVTSDGRSVAEVLISEGLADHYRGSRRKAGWCSDADKAMYRAAVKIFKRGR